MLIKRIKLAPALEAGTVKLFARSLSTNEVKVVEDLSWLTSYMMHNRDYAGCKKYEFEMEVAEDEIAMINNSLLNTSVSTIAQQLLALGLIKSFDDKPNNDRYFEFISLDDEMFWYQSEEQAKQQAKPDLLKILNEYLLKQNNGLTVEMPATRDRNAAAKALMDLDWTFDEVVAVLKLEGDRQ